MATENPHIPKLQKKVATMPQSPGVYRWMDDKENILYIGKAKKLRDRLRSYVQKPDKSLGPWKLSLIEKIADVDITVTHSELEALVLETNLIKEVKPKYNVMMKDDKSYVYVEITTKDAYPHINVVRKMENKDAKYFGPYLTAHRVRHALDLLHDILDFRACKDSINKANRSPHSTFHIPHSKQCLQSQIGQCNGLCAGNITAEEYQERITKVMDFFKGNCAPIKTQGAEMMKAAAANKKFERAAKLRDALAAIDQIQETQLVSDTSGHFTDYVAVALANGKALAVILQERDGKMIGEKSFILKGQPDSIAEALEQFIPQYYSEIPTIPSVVAIADGIENTDVMEEWLTHTANKKVELRIPQRGKRSKLLDLAYTNAEEKLRQQAAAWEAAARNLDEALTQLQEALSLSEKPKRIEGYDISHLGGTETVGSMVVIHNGKPQKKDYRSFTIQSLKKGDIDDYKALHEVLTRRLRHIERHIKYQEKLWKEQGITIAKARKAEQKSIEDIMRKNADHFHLENIHYKDFLVARKEEEIIGFVRLYALNAKTLELKSLWVADDFRKKGLARLLARKILSTTTEKVYATVHPNLEEYYATLDFQVVHTPPDIITKEMEDAKKRGGLFTEGTAMVNLPATRKEDASLATVPDLLVIDGGKGQLSTVCSALKDMHMDIPVIGLAKKHEEVFVPGNPVSIAFASSSQGSFLLQRLRDEAHRFANAHREKRLEKSAIGSALDDIPGIGPKTRKQLLIKFHTVEGVTAASNEELLTIVTKTQLDALRMYLGDKEK